MLLNTKLAFRETKQCMTTGEAGIGIKDINALLKNDPRSNFTWKNEFYFSLLFVYMIEDPLVVSCFFFSVYEFFQPSHFRFLYLRSIRLRKTSDKNYRNIAAITS